MVVKVAAWEGLALGPVALALQLLMKWKIKRESWTIESHSPSTRTFHTSPSAPRTMCGLFWLPKARMGGSSANVPLHVIAGPPGAVLRSTSGVEIGPDTLKLT